MEVTNAFSPNLQVELSGVRDLAPLNKIEGVPSLKVLEEAYGSKFASRVWLKTQLIIVNDFVGTKEKLDDMQLNTLCDQILVQYPGLNLMELCCFFARLRSGKYEKFYGAIDPMRILTSLESFIEDWQRDLEKAWREEERIKREKEWAEWEKSKMSFSDWLATLPEEEQQKVRENFGMIQKVVGEEEIKKRKRSWPKVIGDLLK